MPKRISINDIAKELNVAISTVSAVLNGKAEERRISAAMAQRVMEHARKIGYKPNMVARSLRTGKSNIIGMLVEDISDPFFASIARLVEKRAAEHDYKLFYSSTENKPFIARSLIRAFRDRQVDGYIIAPTPEIEKEINLLKNEGVPLVLFDRYFPEAETNYVVVDNFESSYKATKHLMDNGYNNIAFVTIKSNQTQMADRLKGYEAAMTEMGYPTVMKKVDYSMSDKILYDKIEAFLKANPKIDAVFFATNYLAVNGLKVIRNLKLQIPENIAMLGFDDNTHFNLFTPSISSVAQPIEQIASEIVRVLMKDMLGNAKEISKEHIVLNCELIVRNSSGRSV
ncbi:hypothetical protein A9P82_12715 [Arachidicoccus ginsenosidimutans]|uniref:LacI family DNA-binding transcriptional regulator n=1 Tax=Arachidicoccus sp. BS20 TaxID=1850526 RepID=UPI0007F085ED|nr:substrate-binding domain-containing protein [Arachidicoccus sp. BS20]ANI90070.1 hypothetical protein A9P82_12715 [Arachidicoccus sp. BS20]